MKSRMRTKRHRGDGTQTPDDDEYADMNTEEWPEQDDFNSETYNKYIGAGVMIDVIWRRA